MFSYVNWEWNNRITYLIKDWVEIAKVNWFRIITFNYSLNWDYYYTIYNKENNKEKLFKNWIIIWEYSKVIFIDNSNYVLIKKYESNKEYYSFINSNKNSINNKVNKKTFYKTVYKQKDSYKSKIYKQYWWNKFKKKLQKLYDKNPSKIQKIYITIANKIKKINKSKISDTKKIKLLSKYWALLEIFSESISTINTWESDIDSIFKSLVSES